jgi:hypothetical protein
MTKDIRLPGSYAVRKFPDGWYIVERLLQSREGVVLRESGQIMGPFPTREEALEAYAEAESWDD